MEFSRESPLFEKQLPVYLLKQDDHENLLTFRILQGSQDNNKTHDRVLYFELADDNDPYFLYFLELSEQDFPSLKKEQSILVDFSTFPSKLIELLLLCHQSNSQIKTNPSEVDNNLNKSNDPTYSVKLDTTNGLFSIVESNRFKQLTHISLQLRPGNDASIKSYLASRLSYTTSQLRQVNKDLSYSKDQLNAEISLRREMAEELRDLKSSRDNEMHATRNSHAEELLQVQSKAAETLERTRESYQDQLSQLRSTLENTTKSSNDRISELENSLLNEKQDKSASDFKVKELTHFKEQLENEKSSIFTEASELRKLLRESELQRSSIEREVVKQQMRVEALTTQLNDREESILKSNELQKISGESRKSVEDQLQLYRDSLEAVNEKLLSAVNEIKKGNQEIVRLQQENLQMKERLSTKSEVIRKQEALVVELRNKQLEHDKQLQIVQANLSDSKSEYSSLHREYEKAKEKLTESANIIATNQEVITWLNREISRYQLNGGIPLLGAESFDDKISKTKDHSIFHSPASITLTERDSPLTPSGSTTAHIKLKQTPNTTQESSYMSKYKSGISSATFSQDSKIMASYDYLKKNQGLKGLEDIGLFVESRDESGANNEVNSGYYSGLFGTTDNLTDRSGLSTFKY